MALTQVDGGLLSPTNGQYTGFKSRIINGAMMIDQRNAGAEINPAASGAYYLDRWQVASGAASKFKIGQNAGAVTPPVGFKNYLGCTSLSAYSVGAGEVFQVRQTVEANNVADLGWGAAGAATVTLSFWVYSSLTGTFGGAIRNASTYNYSYPFSYTISSANTWEQKTVTIVGPTTGTFGTGASAGFEVGFSLGSGSAFSSTAGSWQSGNYTSATGATSVVGTNGATFYITGVQLEKGSTATSFDYRPYGTELALCQRYFQNYNGDGSGGKAVMSLGTAPTTSELDCYLTLPVPMRSAPSVAINSLQAYDGVNAASALSSPTAYLNTSSVFGVYFASTGLTLYRPYMVRTNAAGGYLQLSAEL